MASSRSYVMNLFSFFAVSKVIEPITDKGQIDTLYKKLRWSVFISATIGYGLYYVCRLSLNVIKKPIVDAGIMSEAEVGMVGSALFVSYAVGKLTNGFIADRSNIRRFLSAGLLVTAFINLLLGFTTSFGLFLILWGLNGWAQSMGAAPCVVALSRWFGSRERGTYYGLWSSSHNIGEALTFIVTALIVSAFGWQWGFKSVGIIGFVGFLLVVFFMRDTPGSYGLPPIASYKGDHPLSEKVEEQPVGYYQMEVLKNPAIWMLALSSSFMYISRYAVNSWGIFFLEAEKGYTTLQASSIISISSVCGILGTVGSGWISDRFFSGSRNVPTLLFGLMNVAGLMLFLLGPKGTFWIDATGMVLFGLAIGALICYLGGLIAVDIASKKASGAALGIVGIASYAGAAIQDLVSGFTIQTGKSMVDGVVHYNFSAVIWFWIASAILSAIFALTIWNAKVKE